MTKLTHIQLKPLMQLDKNIRTSKELNIGGTQYTLQQSRIFVIGEFVLDCG